jgi:fimbrial chaperone protein
MQVASRRAGGFFDRLRAHFKRGDTLLAAGVLGILCGCFAAPASAGNFAVTPVRIYMASRERATAITVTNDGDEELVMQADIYEWKQSPDGQDLLTLTEDMIMSPPILKMAPRSRQVVRLISLIGVVEDQQQTYRMIVREIPEARSDKADLSLQIAYAFSIPIFMTPPGALARLDCKLARVAADAAKAVCQNTGTAAAHPTALQISNSAQEIVASQDSGAYILPGVSRSFDLKRKEGTIPAGPTRLVISMSDGTSQSYDTTISE